MVKGVEDFVYNMLVNVFNAEGTATLAKEAILRSGSYDLGAKGHKIEDAAEWTREKIIARAKTLDVDKGPDGDFDD
jgi:fructose-bisphosphate aldolase class II